MPPLLKYTGKAPAITQRLSGFPAATAFKLKSWQEPAIAPMCDLLKRGKSGLLIAEAGSGKAYWLAEMVYQITHTLKYKCPVFVITKRGVAIQTRRVLRSRGLTHKEAFVVTYNTMRSSIGEIYIEWGTKIVNSQPVPWPFWRVSSAPKVLLLDESQNVKNRDSDQSKIIQSYIEAKLGQVIFISATPYSRPVQTMCPAMALLGIPRLNFSSWAAGYCGNADIHDWTPASMQRIQQQFEPYTVRFGKIEYEHATVIRQVLIDFSTVEKEQAYHAAFEEYQEVLKKKGLDPLFGPAALLVAQIKWGQKAELLRSEEMALFAVEFERKGNNVILGIGHIETLHTIKRILVEVYNVPLANITEICGGQTDAQRQDNIDRFQREEAHIILLMIGAGGEGISLHHDPTNSRPRKAFLAAIWNDLTFIQLLGRAHRCNSQSRTEQFIICYRNTIEQTKLNKVKRKCRSLREVVGRTNMAMNSLHKEDEQLVSEESSIDIDSKVEVVDEDADDESSMIPEHMPIEIE